MPENNQNIENKLLSDSADKIIKDSNGNYEVRIIKPHLGYLIIVDQHKVTHEIRDRIFHPDVSEALVTTYKQPKTGE